MIPRWKLVRELRRIREQLIQIPWYLTNKLQKNAHDRRKNQALQVTSGSAPLAPTVAIVLVFQPNGILPSTLALLEYLQKKNVSPIIVSNAQVSQGDLEKLALLSNRIIVRPNFGYDFGGYRDGVLYCIENGIRPENLIVMNDSVWLPAHRDSDPVGDALEHPADLVGITYYHHKNKPRLDHIQSYFYRFGGRILTDPDFEKYWREMPVSNTRYTVIRKCEMRLTETFRSKGYTVGVLCDDVSATPVLKDLSEAELRDVVAYVNSDLLRHAPKFKTLTEQLESQNDWQVELNNLVSSGRLTVPFLILHPAVMVRRCRAPILKKNRDGYYVSQRKEIARLGLLSELNDTVAAEVSGWDA